MAVLNERELHERIASIEEHLLRELPSAARAHPPGKAAYCLFLQYVGFDTYDTYRPLVGWGLERARQQLIAEHDDEAWQYLWSPHEFEDIEPFRVYEVGDDHCRMLCQECLRHFFDSIGDRTPSDLEEEASILLPFRQMIHRVSLKANTWDWSAICDVTRDFVVVPMHWSEYGSIDDMELGVPRDKLDRLRDQSLYRFLSESQRQSAVTPQAMENSS